MISEVIEGWSENYANTSKHDALVMARNLLICEPSSNLESPVALKGGNPKNSYTAIRAASLPTPRSSRRVAILRKHGEGRVDCIFGEILLQ